MITIQKIKKITKDAKNENMQKEKELIIQRYILPAALMGKNFCTIDGDTDDEIITMLKADGYEINYCEADYLSRDYYRIKWE